MVVSFGIVGTYEQPHIQTVAVFGVLAHAQLSFGALGFHKYKECSSSTGIILT